MDPWPRATKLWSVWPEAYALRCGWKGYGEDQMHFLNLGNQNNESTGTVGVNCGKSLWLYMKYSRKSDPWKEACPVGKRQGNSWMKFVPVAGGPFVTAERGLSHTFCPCFLLWDHEVTAAESPMALFLQLRLGSWQGRMLSWRMGGAGNFWHPEVPSRAGPLSVWWGFPLWIDPVTKAWNEEWVFGSEGRLRKVLPCDL